MTRSSRPYNDPSAVIAVPVAGAVDVSEPVAGYFRFRLRSGSPYGVVRIWHGQPKDPVTGELLDRSWRWQCEYNGEPLDFDRAWPGCAGSPVTEQDYRRAIARQDWAKQHAPESAYADPSKRHDPLTSPVLF